MKAKTKGSALVSALFIVAIVAMIATSMAQRFQKDIYFANISLIRDRLFFAAKAIEIWSLNQLSEKKQNLHAINSKGQLDRYKMRLNHYNPNIIISGELYDAQARFNLNNLESANYHQSFKRFLELRLKSCNAAEREAIFLNILQLIQAEHKSQTENPQSTNFTAYQPQKSGPIEDKSVLLTIPGLSFEIYLDLENDLTVLPEKAPINIYTASPELLRSLSETLTEKDIDELLALRISDASALIRAQMLSIINRAQVDPSIITEESAYFISKATVHSSESILNLYTLYHRESLKENRYQTSVIRQSLNLI